MFPPQQWDQLHLKAWSWFKSKLFQRYVQFDVGCDLAKYGNKVETNVKIHLQNFPTESNFESVQKPFQKGRLQINAACVGMPT
jgi:hypothetical protein